MTSLALPAHTARRLLKAPQRRGLEPAQLLDLLLDQTGDQQAPSTHDHLSAFCGTETAEVPDVSTTLDRYMEGYGR